MESTSTQAVPLLLGAAIVGFVIGVGVMYLWLKPKPMGVTTHPVTISVDETQDPPQLTVDPDPLKGVHFGDVVVFVNTTKAKVKVLFPEAGNPFFESSSMELPETVGATASRTVAIDPQNETQITYKVIAPPYTEESPRIIVGPKPPDDGNDT